MFGGSIEIGANWGAKHKIGSYWNGDPRFGAVGIAHVMFSTSAIVYRVNMSHIHKVIIYGFLLVIKELLHQCGRVVKGGIMSEIIVHFREDEGVDI